MVKSKPNYLILESAIERTISFEEKSGEMAIAERKSAGIN